MLEIPAEERSEIHIEPDVWTKPDKVQRSKADNIKEWANFANETRGGYGGNSIEDLTGLDEKQAESWTNKIKTIFKLIAGVGILLLVLVQHIGMLNTLKSESLNLVSRTDVRYNLTNDLMPVHFFSEFNKI